MIWKIRETILQQPFPTNSKKGRDAYCLRHYYATERLTSGVPIYTLAKNMATSVQMIERHYGHLAPEMAADVLTQQGGEE